MKTLRNASLLILAAASLTTAAAYALPHFHLGLADLFDAAMATLILAGLSWILYLDTKPLRYLADHTTAAADSRATAKSALGCYPSALACAR